MRETSNLVIETVEKKPGAKVKHRFVGDASKVVAKGNGLKKAFAGRAANFSVEVKGAGWNETSISCTECAVHNNNE